MSETSFERGYRQGQAGEFGATKPGTFTQRLGPLPLWGWMAVALLLALGFYLFRKNSSSTNSASPTGTTDSSMVPQFVNQVYNQEEPPNDGNNGPPAAAAGAKVWGGKVTNLLPSRATVTWMGSGADAYKVTINGPGFNHKVNTVKNKQAVFTGLHAGHNYTVTIQPLVAGAPTGNPGNVQILTPKK